MVGLLNSMWGRSRSFATWPGRKGGIWVETEVAVVARILHIWGHVTPVCQQGLGGQSEMPGSAHPEVLAQIDLAHHFVANNLVGGAAHQDVTIVQNVGPVDNFQCLADVVVSDQDADPA